MRLKGTIFESLLITKGDIEHLLLFDENYYYLLEEDEINKIHNRELNTFSSTMLLDGMWVANKNSNITKYVDVFNTGNVFNSIPFTIAEIKSINDSIVASTSGVRKRTLISYSCNNKNSVEKEFYKGLKFVLDDDLIFTRSNNEKLIECYTYNLEKIWEYSKLEGRIYLDFERAPQVYNDLLIINHAHDTMALDKKTGEEVWKYTFEDIPTSNVLMNGEIYAVCKAQLYIIDPENGEVLLKAGTGYPELFPDTGQAYRDKNQIGIFPVGDYLYGVARYQGEGKLFRLYNKDCSKILYEVEWDKSNQEMYYLNPFTSIQPIIHDNKIYQTLRNLYSFSDSGILVMELTEDDSQAGIKVVPRPPVTMMANPSLSEPHKQQVFLDVDNLVDALRYGGLLAKELQYATGYIAAYHDRKNALDTKHNGELELIIDDTGFEEGADEYLNSLSDRLKEFLEGDTCRAGDKQTPIKFTLIKQPKSAWNMAGEQLDWPSIRDQEVPLS